MSPSAAGASLPSVRVIVVEDEPLFRDLLVGAIISRIPVATVIGQFSTAEECLAETANLEADVLLTDIDLGPGATGVSLAIVMRQQGRARGVVLLSNLAMPNVISTVPSDIADGWAYLLKTNASNIDQVGRAILAAARGDVMIDESLVNSMGAVEPSPLDALTPRQLDVLARMASGLANKTIAAELGLTPRTVESLVSQIFENLGLSEGSEGLNPRVSAILIYLKHVVPEMKATR